MIVEFVGQGWDVVPGNMMLRHVMPTDDIKCHHADSSCWCRPYVDIVDDTVLIHNSLDGREEYESGKKRVC